MYSSLPKADFAKSFFRVTRRLCPTGFVAIPYDHGASSQWVGSQWVGDFPSWLFGPAEGQQFSAFILTYLLAFLTLLIFESPVCGPVSDQTPPYDVFPDAKPPYYRVRYEASKEPGELVFGVNYTIWIPPTANKVRGIIVHQHGCGEGSCKSGLSGAYDLHWQALAEKHHCALMAPSYEQPAKADCQLWCDPRNGSSDAFHQALRDLGESSNHPELADVPWALWGHSGGGHWAGGMVLLHPEKVAAAWLGPESHCLSPTLNAQPYSLMIYPKRLCPSPSCATLAPKKA